MPRSPVLLLASLALSAAPAIFAQGTGAANPSSPGYDSRPPITGEVLNADTGAPIPSAIVHYMGVGNLSITDERRVLNPNTLRGEVSTATDGSYALPSLPPGDFHVRVRATGFLSDDSNVQSGFARDFRLEPDPLALQPMSDAALAAFALPSNGCCAGHDYRVAAFSQDGNRLAFFTLDGYTPPIVGDVVPTAFQRCVAWIYDLKNGVLQAVDQREESGVCDSTAIAWDGDTFYTNSFPYPGPQTGSSPVAERIKARDVTIMPVSALPQSVKQTFAHEAARVAVAQKLGFYPPAGAVTADGLFAVALELEGRSSCGPLVVTSIQSRRKRTLASDECVGFSLMLEGDRLFYSEDPNSVQSLSANITEFNMKTGTRRVFAVPYHRDDAPQFIAHELLPNGALRVAYSIKGDCDPASTDYNDMSPELDLGPFPNQSSVCFITIPRAPVSASSPAPK
jgi:hypothetical protein